MKPLKILISYAYKDTFEWERLFSLVEKKEIQILIDSGAFTAYTLGKPIDLKEYCAWLHEYKKYFWNYFQLDVIRESDKTFNNYISMRKEGLAPIPIFTLGSKQKQLDKYFEYTDFVGIGGLVGSKMGEYIPKLCAYFNKHKKKCHLLGYTRDKVLKTFRPYSCDSSNILGGAKFGAQCYFDNIGKKLVGFDRATISPSVLRYFQQYDFPIKHLYQKEKWGSWKKHSISTFSLGAWVLYQEYLSTINVRLWFAFNNQSIFEAIYYIREHIKNVRSNKRT